VKALIISYLAKVGVKASGLLGWLAGLLIDRALLWVQGQFVRAFDAVVFYFKDKKAAKHEKQNEEKYNESLQDGAAESDQHDATTDLLNGR